MDIICRFPNITTGVSDIFNIQQTAQHISLFNFHKVSTQLELFKKKDDK